MSCEIELPPGFRFHPTDEELITYYLRNQAASRPCPSAVIPEVNIYKFDPWELPGKSELCEGEWYFFTPRHRKYPNGTRPNRATASGYWKATGTDKAIYSGARDVGVKKALVFYKGRPPKGSKTEWIMHEYRLGLSVNPVGSADVLDEWVLCRIYQKKQQKSYGEDSPSWETSFTRVLDIKEEKMPVLPRPCSIVNLLESDYITASVMFDDAPFGSIDDLFKGSSGGGGDVGVKIMGGQSGSLFNRPAFMDSLFQH